MNTHTKNMDWNFPFRSRRSPVLADNVIACSQPLAAQAGIAMLMRGGNAVDAAIAAATTLTVVEPVMNGLGSDAFAQVWHGGALATLDAAGRSPAGWTPQRFAALERMPTTGWDAVLVPGAVSAWIALWRRYASLPLETLLAPAIGYARNGYAVSPVIARQWARQVPRLQAQPGFAEAFMPGGRPPRVGERFRLPALGDSLEKIAKTEGRAFYDGEIADMLVRHAQRHGAALTRDDLARHEAAWVTPLSLRYRSAEVFEPPPGNQGIAVQIALGMLAHFDLGSQAMTQAQRMHLQIEAMKIAFADVYRWVADPASMPMPAKDLLDPGYLSSRAAQIDPRRAAAWQPRALAGGNTVYLAAADANGTLVSFIQSNFEGFGSGVVVPEAGASLANRGSGFSLEPGHPNQVMGGKKPFHTIVPAMLVRDGQALGALGVVGADMQPQGQVQIVSHLEDMARNPQAALDAPRWRVLANGKLRLEAEVDAETAAQLQSFGHDLTLADQGDLDFGGGQLVLHTGQGWSAASDARRDGAAAGF